MSQAGSFSIGPTSSNAVNAFFPNGVLNLYDDFFPHSTGIGQLDWQIGFTSVIPQVNGTAAHPGLVQLTDNAISGIFLGSSLGNSPMVVGGGTIAVNWVISLVTLSIAGNRYTVQAGMSGDQVATPITNGIYLSYSDNVNSGNWVLNCTSASVTTSVNTSVAAVTGFVNLGIKINAAGTSVSFTINGATVGTPITTNIPSVAIGPSIQWNRSSGALPVSLIDLFYLTNVLTTAR